MKKQYWILILIIVVLILGYLGRHRIKTFLSGTPPTPQPARTVTRAPAPAAPPAATASGSSTVTIQSRSNSTKGDFLVGPSGMTLYVFDKDKPGVSNCTDSCTVLWPPYKMGSTSALPANVATLKRPDGSLQYTYKNMPLYYYVPDKKPGDVLGDGIGGTWHLVKP